VRPQFCGSPDFHVGGGVVMRSVRATSARDLEPPAVARSVILWSLLIADAVPKIQTRLSAAVVTALSPKMAQQVRCPVTCSIASCYLLANDGGQERAGEEIQD
jgi:hypothetical protein